MIYILFRIKIEFQYSSSPIDKLVCGMIKFFLCVSEDQFLCCITRLTVTDTARKVKTKKKKKKLFFLFCFVFSLRVKKKTNFLFYLFLSRQEGLFRMRHLYHNTLLVKIGLLMLVLYLANCN